MIEQDQSPCPFCKQPVDWKWDKGFVPEPHNVLIADWVYHSECWDKLIELAPPDAST